MPTLPLPRRALAACLLVLLSACGGDPGDATRPPPEVAVVEIRPEQVSLTTELPGRLEASRVAEVRARATGIVLERTFDEGGAVDEGQVLYRIDPEPLRAAWDSARASLAQAEATLTQARLRAERIAPLVDTNAVSRQDHDDAVAAHAKARAAVAAAKAAVRTAKLNLDYATVRSPISGRIGRALVTEGALVSQAQATPLATVQRLDPMYVNITRSSAEMLALQRAIARGDLGDVDGEVPVTVVTEDGVAHPHTGRLLSTDVSVDPTTGAVVLRAEVPNPQHTLLPGMYVRARLQQATMPDAVLVPQQAVVRDAGGTSVRVVDDEGVVAVRPVRLGPAQGDAYLIEDGLEAGDRVVVEGFQKIRPGAPVTAVPWDPPSLSEPGTPAATAPREH